MSQNDDIQERITQSFATLVADMTQGTSQRLLDYLAFSARFHQYSPDNRILIFEQCPEATRVAGYNKWKAEGYQVRKGEIGIRIKAPRFRKKQDSEDEEKILVGYIGVSVFDASQLTPEKRPPTLFPDVYGDFDRLYQRVVHAIQKHTIRVLETASTQGANGYSAGGIVAIREELTSGNKCLVLFHEWAHEVMHDAQKRKELAREVKECHAEATAYIVATYYGIPTPYSSDYILHWGNTPEILKAEMESVQSAASTIIHAIETAFEQEQHHDNEDHLP